jgi:hypothetical protein
LRQTWSHPPLGLAGKKAVIVKNHDDGTTVRPYGHATVVGLSKEPRKVRSLAGCCVCRAGASKEQRGLGLNAVSLDARPPGGGMAADHLGLLCSPA